MRDDEKIDPEQIDDNHDPDAELHADHDELVRKGLEAVRRGEVVSHEEVVRRLKETGRAGRS